MTLKIRRARLADAAAIVELEQHFPSDRMSARSVRHLLRSASSVMLVAADLRIVAALVVLTRRGSRIGRVYSIVVDLRARGQGLASRLLARAEALARGRGCEVISLEVRTDNAAALALYERAGYQRVRHLARFYDDGADGVRLQKALRNTTFSR